MIITTALAFFMRFRKNPRMSGEPPRATNPQRETTQPGSLVATGSLPVTNQQAKAIAGKIWLQWTQPSTLNPQPSTPAHPLHMAQRMAVALHLNARDLVAGTLSKRAAKGKGAANAMLLELAAEFTPMAVLQIARRLEDIADRELKTARVQKQIERAESS